MATKWWAHIIIAKPSSLIPYSYSPTAVSVDRNGTSPVFDWDMSTGWVFRIAHDGTSRRMCWLPHKRRYGGVIAWSGQKVAIGAESGLVTILDFSDV
jgi:hypothetical protein